MRRHELGLRALALAGGTAIFLGGVTLLACGSDDAAAGPGGGDGSGGAGGSGGGTAGAGGGGAGGDGGAGGSAGTGGTGGAASVCGDGQLGPGEGCDDGNLIDGDGCSAACVSDTAPTCTVTAPLDGTSQEFDSTWTFIASASDPQDGPLSGASVIWRSDRAAAPLGNGASLSIVLPLPGSHVISCVAVDSDGNSGSGSVAVTAVSPVAVINHPGDGETRAAGADVPFVGRGRDFEDGTLTGASLVWTSSLDGPIGTGETFNAPLSAGTNVVTLTVTDADGNVATDTVTLTMTP